MLISFKVSNFLSFAAEQELSMVADSKVKELKDENTWLPRLSGQPRLRLLKGVGIYGANASGKSNLLEALGFVVGWVSQSEAMPADGEDVASKAYQLGDPLNASTTSFTLVFGHDGYCYTYSVELMDRLVCHEELVQRDGQDSRLLFRRSLVPPEGEVWVWTHGTNSQIEQQIEKMTRPDVPYLHVAAAFNHPELSRIHKWFTEYFWFVAVRNTMSEPHYGTTARAILQNPELRIKVVEVLKLADPGIRDIEVWLESQEHVFHDRQGASKRIANEVPRVIVTIATAEGGSRRFDFMTSASLGTKRVFALLAPWLEVLDNGGILVIDELESRLHPLLARELLRLFLTSQKPDKPAQIIFTTHNPLLLDNELLRRDQVWFTAKNAQNATELYPLTDFKARENEALWRGYLAGRYGAIPDIPRDAKP